MIELLTGNRDPIFRAVVLEDRYRYRPSVRSIISIDRRAGGLRPAVDLTGRTTPTVSGTTWMVGRVGSCVAVSGGTEHLSFAFGWGWGGWTAGTVICYASPQTTASLNPLLSDSFFGFSIDGTIYLRNDTADDSWKASLRRVDTSWQDVTSPAGSHSVGWAMMGLSWGANGYRMYKDGLLIGSHSDTAGLSNDLAGSLKLNLGDQAYGNHRIAWSGIWAEQLTDADMRSIARGRRVAA